MCGQPILVINVITKGKGREGTEDGGREGRKEGLEGTRALSLDQSTDYLGPKLC